LSRHRGLRYWLSVYGLIVFPPVAVLFVVNALVIGWQDAYDVVAQIVSPWKTSVPGLALPLALAGYLAIPSLVGAVAGQVVVETTENRRNRSASGRARGGRRIPLLDHLLYTRHGFVVRQKFPQEFAGVHGGNWVIARNHWEKMVTDYLNNIATDDTSYMSPNEALIMAVNAAAGVLPEPVVRCPKCPPRTNDLTEGIAAT
jgi:hypothetical protein